MRIKLSILLLLLIVGGLSAQQDSNRIYMVVSQMPTFPGNVDNYLADHIQYPELAKRNGIQGTVNVTFVISQTGEISEVSVLTGIAPDIDSEAVRVVRAMPPWNPGMKDGKAVRVQYNLQVYIGPSNSNHNDYPQGQNNYKPEDTTYVLRDGIYLDPYYGIGTGGPQFILPTQLNESISMKFGIEASYLFPSNIGISIGVQAQQFKFGYSYNKVAEGSTYNGTATISRSTANDTTVTAGYNESINYSFTYAEVPILCRYITSHENKPGFYVEAGVVVNYLLNSQISGSITQTQYQLAQAPQTYWYMYNGTYPGNPTPVSMAAQNPAKLTLSFHAAAGVLIPFTSKISLIVDFSPDFGLMNAGDGSKDVVNFGTTKYYVYGNGNYGSFNSYFGEVKLLIKLSGSSRIVHY